tara:strand:+ start:15694 stop:17736 length:2043 start_codon:yes stop_codon:yes gene_type:complete
MQFILKNFLFLFAFVCINTNTIIAQVDSIQLYKERIIEITSSPNFSESNITYIDLLNNLSYRLRYSELDSMESLSKKALQLSKNINYKEGELEALTNFSAFHLYSGDTGKAIEYGNLVLEAKEISNFPQKKMKVYNQLGQAYFIKQDYPLTYSHFLNAISLSEKYHDESYKFRMNMNLGTMFNLLEDYDEAIVFYTEALKSSEKLKDEEMDAMVSSNLGYLFIQKEDFKKAEALLLKSTAYFEKAKINEWLAFSCATLGQLNLKLNNYSEAIVNYDKALLLHKSLNDIKGRADINYGLAKANFGLGNSVQAEEFVNESKKLYETFKLNSGLEKVNRLLYQIKKDQNKISESLAYLELAENLANNISKEKNIRNLNLQNAKLNIEKEKENLVIKNRLAIEKQRKYVKWSLAALLTLFVIVLIILNSNKREKLLNKKLENQTIELKENQKTLTNINQNQDRLFSIVGHDLRGPIISLKELLTFYIEDPDGKVYFEKFAPQLREDLEQVQFTMDNLLHWGKTQMSGNQIRLEKISVRDEIENIIHFFSREIKKKCIEIDNQLIDTHFVYADLNQFNVIFRNLISNALKFTPNEGRITFSSKIKEANLLIEVSDTGVGMSELAISKLFKDTEHISTSGTNLEKGTGLGLRLAKEMIVKNNGKIFVKSKINKGSQFIVELPLPTP